MSHSLSFADLSQYDRHAHLLEYGHQSDTRHMLQQHPNSTLINDWLAAKLKSNRQPATIQQWPSVMAAQWHGWQHYYLGHYLKSAHYFCQAWQLIEQGEAELGFKKDIALGLGKVYTRTGHWHSAREWLLLFLAESRQSGELFNVTQGYGALGELLLRANHPQEALACLNIAFHTMPAGSGQQSKQLNYVASALARNNEWLRADTLLKTSIQNARDMLGRHGASQEASDSIHHALARLQFLALARDGSNAQDVVAKWNNTLTVHSLQATPIAQGMLAIGRALCCVNGQQHHDALIYLQQAQSHLKAMYPMEYGWAVQLTQAILGQPLLIMDNICQLMQLTPLTAPCCSNTLDQTWKTPLLSSTNGFAELANPSATLHTLQQQWRIFFV